MADNLAGATQSYLSGAAYYAHGGVQQETWGNSAIQSVEFNARLQPTAINLERSGNLLQRYEYKYGQVNIDTGVPDALNNGQVGRVDAFIGKNGTTPIKQWEQRFTYDTLGRLSRAREVRADNGASVWQQHYTYDRFGNRYQAPAGTSGQYNEGVPWLKVEAADINRATNRYTLPQISYNAAGQITQDTYHRNSKYTYDANGRVRSWMRPDNTNLRTNVIDGAGQRVRSIANSFSTTSIYDVFGRLSAEYDSRQPSLRAENIYRGAGGTLLAVRTTSTKLLVGGGYGVSVQWVLSDLAGSTRLTSGASGAVIARRDYTPFGEELGAGVGTRDGTQGYGVSFSARQGFALTERDEATGLEDTPWRKMDAKAGCWTTPDPYLGSMSVGDPQSFNRYAYVQNDPVNLVDPSGLNAQAPSPMWRPGVGGYGCDASYGSCGGGWDGTGGGGGGGFGFSGGLFDSERFNPGSAGEAAYAGRLQNTYDAIAARNALNNEDYDRLAAILNGNENVGLSVDGEEFYGALGGLLASAMGGEFGNAFQRGGGARRPPPRRGGGSSRSARFPGLKDHTRSHQIGGRTLTYRQYLQSAVQHTQRYHARYLVNYHINGHNFSRYNYVNRIGNDSFLFTSTSPNGRTLFTHMEVNGQYLRNQGIHVGSYPPGFMGPIGIP